MIQKIENSFTRELRGVGVSVPLSVVVAIELAASIAATN
jgi:hypothetical protein